MKKLLLLTLLVSFSSHADITETIKSGTYVCYSGRGDSSALDYKEDYKQCVREGDWNLPGTKGMQSRSYTKACKQFSLELNCKKVK